MRGWPASGGSREAQPAAIGDPEAIQIISVQACERSKSF